MAKGKKVSAVHLWCHLPSPCISPDRQTPLKQAKNLRPSNPPQFSRAKAWIFYISASLLSPTTASLHFFSSNSQTLCICISHAGLIRRCRAMQQQPGLGKRCGCHGDPTQGHLLSFCFFSPFPPLLMMLLLPFVWVQFISQCSITSLNPVPDLRGLFVFLFFLWSRMFIAEN